jgi:hypothetical protein
MLNFEELMILRPRLRRRWFLDRHACSAYRDVAWRIHAPLAFGKFQSGKGDIAFLVRKTNRFIVNVDEVMSAMHELFSEEVRTLEFEDLDFAGQVHAMSSVKLLVAPHGAGLTNIAFMQPGSALIEVFPVHWHPSFYFDDLARTCGMWYRAYQNNNVQHAILDDTCKKEMGQLPNLANCTNQARCLWCGKQSSSIVDMVQMNKLLGEAYQYLSQGRLS